MNREFPPNPIEKGGYILEFNDEFKNDELDEDKWIPFYLPHWSSRSKSRANFEVKERSLVLKINKNQSPWCPEFNNEVKVSSLQTGLFSGKLGSTQGQHRVNPLCQVREEQTPTKLYTPLYGYFEIRAKAVAFPDNVCAFWMIGFEDQPAKSAEICIMEIKGQNLKMGQAINGYGVRAFADPGIKDEFFEDPFDIDATYYNTYAAEWKPDRIDFYLNNKKVRTIWQSPSYQMQFMLNIYEVPIEENLGSNETHYPKCFEIDYVRAYRPVGNYD